MRHFQSVLSVGLTVVGLVIPLFVCALALPGCAVRSQQACGDPVALRDNQPREVTLLGDDLSSVRDAFNGASDRWRAVALVSPTCSECLLGAKAVRKEIIDRYPANDVAAVVVWIPMLDSDNEQATKASATIFPPARSAQFYDAHQGVGLGYARHTFAGFYNRARKSLPDGHWLAQAFDAGSEAPRPQWDLYMLYAPGVRWADEAPPMPTHWIRHLGRKQDGKTSTYWRDSPEGGPHEGDLFDAMRQMADDAIGKPCATAMNSTVNIEVLGFTDCPNTPATRVNVAKAIAALGLAANVSYVDQERLPESDRRRAWPTPTVLVDGRDLFGMPAPQGSAMGCRVYLNGGAPSEAAITIALKSLARR